MQAYHLDRFGDLDGLVLRDGPMPVPGPHQALVRIRAASLNYRDLMVLDRRYPVPSPEGVIPLSDGAGEVVAVGPGVTRVAVGDRVAATYFRRWIDGRLTRELAWEQFGSSQDGMLAEFRAIDEESLVRIPAHLSFEEAACLPCAAVTAWSAVTGGRPILPGDTVLTLGAGGVALFAAQFARAFGARVIAVTSGPDKAAAMRRLGAEAVVDRAAVPAWDKAVLDLTDGRGVDHAVEAIGPETLERTIRATGFDGQIAMVGVFASEDSRFDPWVLAGRLVTIRRIAVGSRAGFEAMNRAIGQSGLRPVIDRVFPFAEAKRAYRHVIGRGHIGKVVITIA